MVEGVPKVVKKEVSKADGEEMLEKQEQENERKYEALEEDMFDLCFLR